jgi:hypothetical protein
MNIKRGFFRIWVVGSAFYVLAVGALFFGDIEKEFKDAALSQEWEGTGTLLVPVMCKEARGKDKEDYDSGGPWNKYRDEPICSYKETDFRRLFPEYNDLSSQDLAVKTYRNIGAEIRMARPWQELLTASGIAFGVPLAVLFVGASLGWAFRGFRETRR